MRTVVFVWDISLITIKKILNTGISKDPLWISKSVFFWDTFFPCRIPEKLETGIIKDFIDLVIQNPEFSDKTPLEIIMYTYQDECIE